MELEQNDYILGYWIASDHEDSNWYALIVKRGNEWLGQYTFRYNHSEEEDDAYSGKDEKNIYNFSAHADTTEEDILKSFNAMFDFVKLKYNNFSDHFLVRGNVKDFMEIAKTKHYMHMKEVPKDQENCCQ